MLYAVLCCGVCRAVLWCMLYCVVLYVVLCCGVLCCDVCCGEYCVVVYIDCAVIYVVV